MSAKQERSCPVRSVSLNSGVATILELLGTNVLRGPQLFGATPCTMGSSVPYILRIGRIFYGPIGRSRVSALWAKNCPSSPNRAQSDLRCINER